LEITDVRVFPVDDEKLKAFVSIVFDRCFMVNDIKVIRGKDGLFISMPSRRKRNGEFKDVAHPLNQETRRRFEVRILAEYEAAIGGGDRAAAAGADGGDQADGGDRTEAAAGSNGTEPAAVERSEQAEVRPSGTLEEIERRHLDDSFWGVR
jgi:stage V sporulation protein G